MTKTCGECKHYNDAMFHCEKFDCMAEDGWSCPDCEEKEKPKPTNGDKIIAGGMRAIAKFALHHCCNNCIYFDGNNPYRSTCGKPDNKTCEDGVEAWLNTPVASEGKDE